MSFRPSGSWFWILLAALANLSCAEAWAHGHAHGPHVHGEARLQLVLEAGTLSVDVRAPGASVVGFERRARDAAEARHVEQVVAYLREPDAWLKPSAAAGCRLAQRSVDGSAFEPGDAPGGGHADVTASYRYACTHPARVAELRVGLFERFPALKRIRVEYIVDGAQGEALLTPRTPAARLRP